MNFITSVTFYATVKPVQDDDSSKTTNAESAQANFHTIVTV